MRNQFYLGYFLILIILTGCVTLGEKKDSILYPLEAAENMFKSGHYVAGHDYLSSLLFPAIADPNDPRLGKIQSVIKKYPNYPKAVVDDIDKDIENIRKFSRKKRINQRIEAAAKSGCISEAEIGRLRTKLEETVQRKLSKGEIQINLSEIHSNSQLLDDEELKKVIFTRSVDQLKKPHTERPRDLCKRVVALASKAGNNSKEMNYIRKEFNNLILSKQELTKLFMPIFPELTFNYILKHSITISVYTDPSRPLIEMDLVDILNSYDFVNAFRGDDKGSIKLTIKELGYEEYIIPEKTIQKYVSWHNMNLVIAMTIYPQNSTAIYDITSGGVTINFAYQIILEENGKILADKVIRDKVENKYRYASNLRYRNVLGGIGVPDMYPNASVEAEFRNSSKCITPEDARKNVFDCLINEIIKLDKIKEAAF